MQQQPLTVKYVIDNKLTGHACVRYFDSTLTEEEVDYILWEQTCYPLS